MRLVESQSLSEHLGSVVPSGKLSSNIIMGGNVGIVERGYSWCANLVQIPALPFSKRVTLDKLLSFDEP